MIQIIGTVSEADCIKARRRADRELEIERHGKAVEMRSWAFRPKKRYDRKAEKRNLRQCYEDYD